MNVQKSVRIGLQISIVLSLLIANTSITAAGGGKGGDIIGQVSTTASKSLPTPTLKELGFQPDSVQPIPSGGTATAIAGLSWSLITMYSTATDSLSANTIGTYNLCARVVQLAMNGIIQGTHANPACGNRVAGGSITDSLNE